MDLSIMYKTYHKKTYARQIFFYFFLIWFFMSTQQSFSYAGRVFLGWTSTKLG